MYESVNICELNTCMPIYSEGAIGLPGSARVLTCHMTRNLAGCWSV